MLRKRDRIWLSRNLLRRERKRNKKIRFILMDSRRMTIVLNRKMKRRSLFALVLRRIRMVMFVI